MDAIHSDYVAISEPQPPDTPADGTVSHHSYEQYPSQTLFSQNPSHPQIAPQFQNQPHETREFRCDESKETLIDTLHQKNDKSTARVDGGRFPKVEIQTPALTDTHSGTDKNQFGEKKENTRKRKFKSRWGPPLPEFSNGETSGSDRDSENRKQPEDKRVVLPYLMSKLPLGIEIDPETQALNDRLLEICRKLQSDLPLHDRPERPGSPYSEPIYDRNGFRINSMEGLAREKLTREKHEIISEMIKRNPVFFKPPADYRPQKLQKELYIPKKEHPGYNFIGLIIGPRKDNQKMTEREISAKIVVTGKGLKDEMKSDSSENEDLNHVLIEAETQESLDAASAMLDKLLQPIDEVLNEQKLQHFRKLETLKKIRDEETCRLCGEPGHKQNVCPEKKSIFKSDVMCRKCGDGGHPTIDCPVKNTTSKKMDDEYQNFLAELGRNVHVPESSTKPTGHAPGRNFAGAPQVYGAVPPNPATFSTGTA